jgi:hypothetical protein
MLCCTEKYKLSHIHDFTNKRFFIGCSQGPPSLSLSLSLSIRINRGSLHRNVSIHTMKEIKITSARYTETAVDRFSANNDSSANLTL